MDKGRSGDELWDEFVKEFEKNNAVKEPSAAERARQSPQQSGQAEASKPRRSTRRVLIPLVVGLLVIGGAGAYAFDSARSDSGTGAAAAPASSAPAASASASASSSAAAASPKATPSAKASPSAKAAAPSSGALSGAIPLSVFPQQVQGYTLVAKQENPVCTGAETVSPTLAGLITQGAGCAGIAQALYRDAAGNQYNLALFTMVDPMDSIDLVNRLSGVREPQVAVLLPPKTSGLTALAADSGIVQNFAVHDHGMLIGMAQWADGRTADYNELVTLLVPLTQAVENRIPLGTDTAGTGSSSPSAPPNRTV
ncbi:MULTISPECIES: hypothetical protein [Kitasatospora]|uniref:Uncharacterized protein n=1 Tax=Kitasatospora setae (strain ATCC 33774 / DSM 43861 / JCM 3304 / KCC A-0304 / NBRC 14216 / KM-6054) TaxID=452652 RepID=E4N6E1_KITSK|nr:MULTISPECIES: hypothetical protein [Kitasatospora]BAJ26772.1 hypothetical protein KSE_09350 [Kitasatospora setae KM-6054]